MNEQTSDEKTQSEENGQSELEARQEPQSGNDQRTADEQQTSDEQQARDEQQTRDESQARDEQAPPSAERLAEAEDQAARARDDLLRVQAEMQNLRRRTEQDVEKAHKYALERFSIELLTVMDNLERATAAAADSEDPAVKALHDGVDLTLKSMSDAFAKFKIEAIDPEGEPFDPQLHQAMSIQENADVEPDTVIAVMQKGYTLNQRVIRPAMVVVSKEAS